MSEPLFRIEQKPTGEFWLHLNPKDGPLSSFNLGYRTSGIIYRSLIATIEQQNPPAVPSDAT